jgi:hypothetical protein
MRTALLLVGSLSFAIPVHAATFQVSSLADAGPGSLRQAVLDANAAPGADEVTFQAGLSGAIALASEILISDDLTITGPGAGLLSISGNGNVRIFHLDGGTRQIAVAVSGLTLTHGFSFLEVGGALWAQHADLTLTDSVVSDSRAFFGGGLYLEAGTHVVRNTTISGNSSGSLNGSSAGGGIVLSGGNLTIDSSTVSGNSAIGGVFHFDAQGGGLVASNGSSVQIVNSTFSGNLSQGEGAAVFVSGSTVDLSLTTVEANAFSGMGRTGFGSLGVDGNGTINLADSIVANTQGPYAVDLRRISGTFNVTYSLVEIPGDAINGTNAHNLFGQDPLLGPLQNNGGPTATHALLPGSPAIDAGDPAIASPPAYDQRGPGFPRIVGSRVDLGSFEEPAQSVIAVPALSPVGILLLCALLAAAGLSKLRH